MLRFIIALTCNLLFTALAGQPATADIQQKTMVAYFNFNATDAEANDWQAIEAGLASMDKGIGIQLHGHTDNVGSTQVNQKISKLRAESVKVKLVALGFDADQIFTYSHGENQPVASNDTEEGRAKNRRVEIVIQ